MTITKDSTVAEVQDFMLQTVNVAHWNERRKYVSWVKDSKFITRVIDHSKLIKKTSFATQPINNVKRYANR